MIKKKSINDISSSRKLWTPQKLVKEFINKKKTSFLFRKWGGKKEGYLWHGDIVISKGEQSMFPVLRQTFLYACLQVVFFFNFFFCEEEKFSKLAKTRTLYGKTRECISTHAWTPYCDKSPTIRAVLSFPAISNVCGCKRFPLYNLSKFCLCMFCCLYKYVRMLNTDCL